MNFVMIFFSQDNNKTERAKPEVTLLGSGTDHASFAFYANIPAIDLEFVPDEKKYPGISSSWYPMYHTGTVYILGQ